MKTLLICLAVIFGFAPATNLTGRWETKPSPTGIVTSAIFNSNNTYEGYKNNELFVSGTYTFRPSDSTITIQDNGCMGMPGNYQVKFFSNGDSIHFTAINDYCFQRKAAIESVVLGKVKP